MARWRACRSRPDQCRLGHALTAPAGPPLYEPAAVGPYFDDLYARLAASATHALIGREALGDAYVGQLGYADQPELVRLAEVAGVGRGRRVLDIACGTGGVVAAMGGWPAPNPPPAHVTTRAKVPLIEMASVVAPGRRFLAP